jgi:hypothetical protein
VHAEFAAVDVCKRCGRFLCGECLELVGEDPYCGDCVKRLGAPVSKLAWVAFGSGFGSFLMMFAALFESKFGVIALPASLVGCVTSIIELMRIRSGHSSRNGRTVTIIGLASSTLMLLILAAVVLAYEAWKSAYLSR